LCNWHAGAKLTAVSPAAPSKPSSWEDRALDRTLAVARDRQATRARSLVDAARRLAAAGRPAFTIAEVAAEAGVSLRSFYRHFAGRDELLLALIEEEARTGVAVLHQVLGVGDPLERLERCVETLCDFVVTGSGYAALLVREHLRLAEAHPDELRAALDPLLDVIERALHDAAAAEVLRPLDRFDAATVLTLVLTHVHGVAVLAPEERAPSRRIWDLCRVAFAPVDGGPQGAT
jgi:AcrR family transcriptional regulator